MRSMIFAFGMKQVWQMTQLYEQGQRDIQKAEAGTIAALADALRCEMQALIRP